MHQKRLAIDLDGTIVQDPGNIELSLLQRTPLIAMEGAAEYINRLAREGYDIIIYTCRPDYHRVYLQQQLRDLHIHHDDILFYTKPRVDFYIDNKGIHFKTWKQVYQEIHLREAATLGLQQPFSLYEKELQKIKIKHLRIPTRKMLDVGCGDGSVFAFTEFKNIHGYDCNLEALELCRLVPNYTATFNTIHPNDVRSYELVTMLGVLEHVEDPWVFMEYFRNAWEIYITVPNALSFHRTVGLQMGILQEIDQLGPADHAIGHKRYFTPEHLRALLVSFCEKHDFTIEKFGTVGFKIAANQQMGHLSDIAVYLDAAAEQISLTGNDCYHGAEIFAILKKG